MLYVVWPRSRELPNRPITPQEKYGQRGSPLRVRGILLLSVMLESLRGSVDPGLFDSLRAVTFPAGELLNISHFLDGQCVGFTLVLWLFSHWSHWAGQASQILRST